MACPLFIPSSPLGDFVSNAPLGDLFAGTCAADPSARMEQETLRRHCNFGYARGQCERAAGSDADAVRLLVRGECGGTVEVAWAVERNHHPVAVGVMQVEKEQAPQASNEPLVSQARARAVVYLRQAHDHTTLIDQLVDRVTAAAHH